MLIEYINTSFKDGNLAIAVIGDKGSVDINKRMENASKIDNYPIVYLQAILSILTVKLSADLRQ